MKIFGAFLIVFAALTVVVGAGKTSAQQCGTRTVTHSAAVATAAVAVVDVTPVFAAQIVTVPVLIPSYTVGYGYQQFSAYQPQIYAGQGQAQAPASVSADVLTELRSLRGEIASLRGMPAPPPSQQPLLKQAGADPATGVLSRNCASCHERSVASAKGRSVVLFDGGNLIALAPETKLEIIAQVLSGKMPPNAKLPDQDVAEILQLTTRRASK